MSLQFISSQIAELRKAKGIKQEELAKAVGVSTQAVSKWECGGTPDTELLPLIADYFNVSIDTLFNRRVDDYSDLKSELAKEIASVEQEKRMAAALEYCWVIEKALCGATDIEPSLKSLQEANKNGYAHSQMLYDSGISLMSIVEKMQYFVLMPEPLNGWKNGLFAIDKYQKLFKFLGDEHALACILFLMQRDNKPFTPKLLEKNIGITIDRAAEILDVLKQYSLIYEKEIELDDQIQKVYEFYANPALIAVLFISNELIKRPNNFHYNSSSRTKPYLRN
jgi:transcriptional regulator with XRE-family HTH domain